MSFHGGYSTQLQSKAGSYIIRTDTAAAQYSQGEAENRSSHETFSQKHRNPSESILDGLTVSAVEGLDVQ